ncbi:MAG: DNA mismatch repair endonuclease MutL [Clostridia bacterium]|nr:DNA mismatch repair endonuclease MutL [Clostridia bacterium]
MAKINILPKHIAELIAAGEVVERPASVVKELMENSIDAGATAITLEIKNGGVTYIRITDNGCGIDKEDVPNAFLSHATSKIKNEEDLNSIFTLGFRGEALASIAAVSRTEVLTKSINQDSGTAYAVSGGTQMKYETAGCPDGTTIIVRDLFYNTPARMKFLKKDVSEANAVAEVVDRIALSHPEISIRFIREGKQALITPGDGKLISAIYSIFGRAFADSLLPVDYELDGIKVQGYTCKPHSARPSRSMQYFYLNNRYIKSRSCIASMENAYKNSVMVGKFPSCVLNITVPPHTVDVNVHPAKTEVRFSDERRVSSAVYYAVKSAIEELDRAPQVDLARLNKLTQKAAPEAVQITMQEVSQPSQAPAAVLKQPVKIEPKAKNYTKNSPRDFWNKMTSAEFQKSVSSTEVENPFIAQKDEPDLVSSFKKKSQSVPATPHKTQTASANAEIIPEPSNADEMKKAANASVAVRNTVSEAVSEKAIEFNAIKEKDLPPKPLRLLGEAFKTYIICEYDGKLCLIDKHAAHERIIYNRLRKNAEENISSQVLLSPVTVTLSKSEYDIVISNLDVFAKAGYLVEDFGTGVVVVRECPMLISSDEIEDTVIETARYLSENRTNTEPEKIDRIYHTAACKAAIKAGYKNSTAEMKVLAEQVLYDTGVRYCPHGRPVLIELSKYELEKQFGRIQ